MAHALGIIQGCCLGVYRLDHISTAGTGFGSGCEKWIRKGFYKYIGLKRMIKEYVPSLKNKTGEMVTTDMEAVQGTVSSPSAAGSLGVPHECSVQLPGETGQACRGLYCSSSNTKSMQREKNTHCKLRCDLYSKTFFPSFQ